MILDAIGHIEAIGVGHYLAERGREVTVVTPLHSPLLLDAETMQKALPAAVRAGVRWRPNTAVVAIGDHEVTVADVMSYAVETLPADHVVIRTHGVANDALYHDAARRGAPRWCASATPSSPAWPTARSTTATSPPAPSSCARRNDRRRHQMGVDGVVVGFGGARCGRRSTRAGGGRRALGRRVERELGARARRR